MKIKLMIIGLAALFAAGVYADNEIKNTFLVGATGTASATVVVPPSYGFGIISHCMYQVDSGNTSSTLNIRPATTSKLITSVTAAGTVVYFDNSATLLSVGGFCLVKDGSGSYQLERVTASATTSVTVATTLTANLALTDSVYPLPTTAIQRPACYPNSATLPWQEMYIPANLPTAITLDGNTTSCKVTVGGVRTQFK